VVAALVEGVSINATVRMTGVAKHTILKFLSDLGCAATAYHHRHVRGLRVRRLQCDEIWAFVGAKKKIATAEQKAAGWGDVWTWTAIDADTKLCVDLPPIFSPRIMRLFPGFELLSHISAGLIFRGAGQLFAHRCFIIRD
jgi:hypothetical protein